MLNRMVISTTVFTLASRQISLYICSANKLKARLRQKTSDAKLRQTLCTQTYFRVLSKSNPNSNSILLGLRLDIVATANPHHPTQHYTTIPQTFQPLLDMLGS